MLGSSGNIQYPTIQHVVLIEPDPMNFSLLAPGEDHSEKRPCQLPPDQTGESDFLVDRTGGCTGTLASTLSRDSVGSLQLRRIA